jgi:hypothetical protein
MKIISQLCSLLVEVISINSLFDAEFDYDSFRKLEQGYSGQISSFVENGQIFTFCGVYFVF